MSKAKRGPFKGCGKKFAPYKDVLGYERHAGVCGYTGLCEDCADRLVAELDRLKVELKEAQERERIARRYYWYEHKS